MAAQKKVFDKKLLEFLVCPLSKTPLRYCEKSQELINEELRVAYPIVNGIPNLVPIEARIMEVEEAEAKKREMGSKGFLSWLRWK